MKAQKFTMTKEELLTKQQEFLEKAEAAASRYNSAETADAANAAETEGKEAVKSYNQIALEIFKAECIEGSPELHADTTDKEAAASEALAFCQAVIRTACLRHEYPARSFKVTAVSESVKTAEVVPVSKLINLTSFNGVILNPWRYRAEILAEFLTREVAAEIGFTTARLNDAMKFFGLSKEAASAAKISNTTYKKVLPDIIARMIGEEYRAKVIAADTNYVKRKFVTGGKSMTVKVASIKQTIALLADVCYRVLTDGFYDLDSKEIRKGMKKAAAKAAK